MQTIDFFTLKRNDMIHLHTFWAVYVYLFDFIQLFCGQPRWSCSQFGSFTKGCKMIYLLFISLSISPFLSLHIFLIQLVIFSLIWITSQLSTSFTNSIVSILLTGVLMKLRNLFRFCTFRTQFHFHNYTISYWHMHCKEISV